MEEPDRPQMTIWHMRIACWIPKTTNAHVSIYNTYSFSTESMDARSSLSLGDTYIAFLVDCWLQM